MAKKKTATKTQPKEAPKPKEKRVLKRPLSIPGVSNYPTGTEVTTAIEKQWKDYYKSKGHSEPLTPLSYYC